MDQIISFILILAFFILLFNYYILTGQTAKVINHYI